MMLSPIDWQLLADAVTFYQNHGYQYVELPYIVEREISDITLPPELGDPLLVVHTGVLDPPIQALVGSAEQSFLSVTLPAGKYVGVTPCFRAEPSYHRLTQPHFMKVELFDNRPEADAWETMLIAKKFMEAYCRHIRSEVTSIGWDLMIGSVEVGSYGVRTFLDDVYYMQWVYGTGLALPRFSLAREPVT